MVSGIVARKLALVTGAGSGIGRAACQVLSKEGATIIAADNNYDFAVETIKTHTAQAICKDIGDHSAVQLDVSDSKSVQNLMKIITEKYKQPPTVVVNSAGIGKGNWLLKLSEENYDTILDVNLKGTFLVMQACAKAMTEASLAGSIVNLSSIAGKYGFKGLSDYSASKAGVVGLTQSAAKELGKFNIRVNVVLPGYIETPIVASVPEKVKANLLKQIALGRFGNPTEVGDLIAFLCSDKSSYVTGAAFDITGGM